MKKIIIAILVAAILALAIPATVLAAPEKDVPACQHTISATVFLACVGRNTTTNTTTGVTTGIVYYKGKVVSALVNNKDFEKLDGAPVVAQEKVYYITDAKGNVIVGKGSGTITIDGAGPAEATFSFSSKISGNVYVGPGGGPAFDNGIWNTVNTHGAYSFLKDARGTWSAAVAVVPTGNPASPYTFAGNATLTGTY